MAIEYLGNKTRLLRFVVAPVARVRSITSIVDLFCGTASVSRAFGERGLRVVANDNMELCSTLAEAALLTERPPRFRGLDGAVSRSRNETMQAAVLRSLNELPPEKGFFFRTYSPGSAATGTPRMYLTEDNAGKVDAIRGQIEEWRPELTRAERAVLLRDLVQAVTAVSNTAGTYGCYLKKWKARALQPLELVPGQPGPLPRQGRRENEVHCTDAESLAPGLAGLDAAYLDPPYTKRQYAAYYHLLETLVSGAQPRVQGSTGLPPWQEKQSDFCFRRRAPAALQRLVQALDVPHIFLSYSDDGHIPHEEIVSILEGCGRVRWWEQTSQRYRSSALDHKAAVVRERLYHVAVA